MFGSYAGPSMTSQHPPFDVKYAPPPPSSMLCQMTMVDSTLSSMGIGAPNSASMAVANAARKIHPRKLCKICAEEATSNHFGALSCHACAAFFRRTVAFRRTYTCRHQQNCKLVNVSPRRMCKYCRLARCLSIGMQPGEVRSNGISGAYSSLPNGGFREDSNSPSAHSDDPSSNASSNSQSPRMLTSFFNLPEVKQISSPPTPTHVSTDSSGSGPPGDDVFSLLRAMILESAVCSAVMHSSGLTEYIRGKDLSLLDKSFAEWINLEVCNSFEDGVIDDDCARCINDQFVDVNLQHIQRAYNIDDNIRSPEWISQFRTFYWQRLVGLSKLLAKSQLDDYEFAALAQLTLIRIACETSDNVTETQISLAPYVSVLMKDIQKHFAVTNASPNPGSSRLASLVLLVSEMQSFRDGFNKTIAETYTNASTCQELKELELIALGIKPTREALNFISNLPTTPPPSLQKQVD